MKKFYLLLLIMFSFAEMKGQGCVISYSYDSTTTTFGFTVSQTSANSIFNWDFGDSTGVYTTGDFTTHTFANLGNYLVCVTEFDTILQTNVSSCCLNINYNNTGGCSFSVSTASNLTMVFYASASSASTITWDFGDGQTGTGFTNTHVYATPGTYNVCMTSSSFLGNCSFCQAVTVPPASGACTISSYTDSSNTFLQHFNFSPIDPGNQIVWTFGDGNIASGGTNQSHVYASTGVFTACANETDSLGTLVCQACYGVQIGPAPNCSFTVIPSGGPLNTYYFNTSFDTLLYAAVWDFGDGISYTGGQSETHTYPSAGNYFACLNIIDQSNQNIACTYCSFINIPGPVPCVANFTTVPNGLDAYFIDYSSTDPSITTYTWDFGDGSPNNTSRFPIHTYSIPGTYTVCLSILNSACADTICQTIVVDSTVIVPLFCTSYFIFTQLSPYQLAVVNLSSGINLSFAWDFGDGSTSNTAYPIHSYSSTGTFEICLTVADQNGCTNTYCDSLTVDSTGMIIYRQSNVGFTINVISPTQLNSVNIEETTSLISNIYPNPSLDRIVVTSSPKSGDAIYSILCLSGQKMKEGNLSGEKSEIDISELASGIYFLEVRTKAGEKSFARFIKE